MKLSANRLAQWFVQGDYFSVSAKQAKLHFCSKNFNESVPFAIWNGQCRIERGLWWGKIYFEFCSLEEKVETIAVLGLPWRKVAHFAQQLAVQYQTWLHEQHQDLLTIEPRLQEQFKQLGDPNAFLRHSELTEWQYASITLMQELNFHPQLLSIFEPELYDKFRNWLIEGETLRSRRNQEWLNVQLQQWQPWFKAAHTPVLSAIQQQAVLTKEDHNLVIGGAAGGKTTTLLAHCDYLLHSKQCRAWQILFIVPDLAVKQKIRSQLSKLGLPAINIVTPVALAQQIIRSNFDELLQISKLISCARSRDKWLTQWLETTFSNTASLKRWQKHIATWPVPGVEPEKPLVEQTTSSDFLLWLWRQLTLLLQQNVPSTAIKQLVHYEPQALSELTLLSPLMHHYQNSLNDNGEHDAKRLLERVTDLLSRKNGAFVHHYTHFLVDEYQALSLPAITFLETLCHTKQSESQKQPVLFATADDLQLIEHFTDPTAVLADDFAERFAHAAIMRLPQSYRFNQYVAKCACAILNAEMTYGAQEDAAAIKLAPPLQSVKSDRKKQVQLIEHSAIPKALLKLATLSGGSPLDILFIGREPRNKPKDLRAWQQSFPMFSMRYKAVTQAKGVEADHCFIVDVNRDVFPAPSQEQGLQYALFSQFSCVDYAKERSLFYLALTRARQCWICYDPERPSLFIEELRQACKNE